MSLPPEVYSRMKQLTEKLNAASKAYYVTSQSTLSDAEYDAMSRELASLEVSTGFNLPESPTRKVGSDLTGSFAKVPHKRPMLSLDNVFTDQEVQAYIGTDRIVVVEPKFDGVSLSLEYTAGVLQIAKTRGDGEFGEDVTANAKTIVGIPLSLPSPVTVEIRGEVVLRNAQLAKFNEIRISEGDEPFANARNAASGTLKQKSPAEVARRKLNFIAYQVFISADWAGSQEAAYALLSNFGFTTSRDFVRGKPFPLSDPAQLAAAIENVRQAKDTIDIDLDGAVVKVNDFKKQEEMGLKAKSPRWGCAFKFPPEQVSTKLLDIELTVGRTGQITPNARLEPVHVGGVMVSNASMMNHDEWSRIGRPVPGDVVIVERSAEVIPRVCGIAEKTGAFEWEFPTTCPSCKQKLIRRGVHYYCVNKDCESQITEKIRHAVAKYALDWDGMGDSAISALRKHGCKDLADVLVISDSEAGLIFKPAAAKKFKAERERVKTTAFWRQLVALGIEDIGKTLSKELALKFHDISDLLTAIDDPVASGLDQIVGPVALKSLVTFMNDNLDYVAQLKLSGMVFKNEETAGGPLTGKTFVITGTLTTGDRDKASTWLESLGAVIKSSVGKTTDYLVVGESPGGNKTSAAAKYGTKTLTEYDLYLLLKNEGVTIPDWFNLDPTN